MSRLASNKTTESSNLTTRRKRHSPLHPYAMKSNINRITIGALRDSFGHVR
jgi:hypothetical protein